MRLELTPRPNKEGLFRIYIRVTENRNHKRIDTGLAVKEMQFKKDALYGTWIRKHPDAPLFNEMLDEKLREVKNIYNKTQTKGEFINKEIIANSFKKRITIMDFFSFWDEKVNQMLNYNQSKGYNSTKNRHLIPFFEDKGFTTVDFRQITPSTLTDFENVLTKKGLDSDSIYTQMKRVRAMFNKAIAEGLIEANVYPFRAYKMPKVTENRKERLTEEEVKRFSEVDLIQGTLIFNVQQSWMLSFYCAGIRAEDLLTLQVKNITNGRLMYQMNKTGAMKSIKITPQIKKILDVFTNSNSVKDDYIFPFLPKEVNKLEQNGMEFKKMISAKTALLNKYLKEIGKIANIEKKITNHIARHSFANVARKKTNDVHAIKSALGHSSVKITEMYLDSFDEEALDSMMNTIFA